MSYQRKDYYFKKAKEENFAARSVFKLEEIDDKFRILRNNDQVLDLGCAPGSWAQYTSKAVGAEGRVIGVDLQEVKIKIPNGIFIQADLNDLRLDDVFHQLGLKKPFDVVLSDMAPKTTGIMITDQVRSLALCELALSCAERFLRTGGHFVCKLFHGGDFQEFRKVLISRFEKVEILRPKSTRKASKEIFLIGMKFKPQG